MLRTLCAALGLCVAGLGAVPALAQSIIKDELIFERGQWTVSKVATDDGTLYCVAAVRGENAWVNVWIEADGTTGIQFDSEDWGYDISTETFIATIDDRKSLNLTNPEIDETAVYFDLPFERKNVTFFRDLRAGRELYLNNTAGELIARFPLEGSSASIDAVDACVDTL